MHFVHLRVHQSLRVLQNRSDGCGNETIFDSFQTGSGQTGSSQKCRDFQSSIVMATCMVLVAHIYGTCGTEMYVICGNMYGICDTFVKTTQGLSLPLLEASDTLWWLPGLLRPSAHVGGGAGAEGIPAPRAILDPVERGGRGGGDTFVCTAYVMYFIT